jgi:ring-1,2-phenylacetyl-CoA epoxidase subunit PaaE
MSNPPRFHDLTVARITPDAPGSVCISLHIPEPLRSTFVFQPGQFLTLRTSLGGQDTRRNYSICSTPAQLAHSGHIDVGVRQVPGGLFSTWANTALKEGDTLSCMPPDGRFGMRRPRAIHRVGFAAGSGITPILSILRHSLESSTHSKFTLVYGNRRMGSVMFNEALQDLKDRYTDRLTLIHVLSRQAQEVPLLEGRIDGPKVQALINAFLPVPSMEEVFVCGPEGMIEATEAALRQAGVKPERIHSERFTSSSPARAAPIETGLAPEGSQVTVVLDGKSHVLSVPPHQAVLDAAVEAGLDVPFACKAGVCCTCRAKVMQGSARMDKNFTLTNAECAQGFVLTCQARPTSDNLVLSYDER